MVNAGVEHLFPRHLHDQFREQAVETVQEEERKGFEMEMEFEEVRELLERLDMG